MVAVTMMKKMRVGNVGDSNADHGVDNMRLGVTPVTTAVIMMTVVVMMTVTVVMIMIMTVYMALAVIIKVCGRLTTYVTVAMICYHT